MLTCEMSEDLNIAPIFPTTGHVSLTSGIAQIWNSFCHLIQYFSIFSYNIFYFFSLTILYYDSQKMKRNISDSRNDTKNMY